MARNDPLSEKNRAYADPLAKQGIAARQPVPPEKLEIKRLIFPLFIAAFLLVTVIVMLA